MKIYITVLAVCMAFAVGLSRGLETTDNEMELCEAETGGNAELLKTAIFSQKWETVKKSEKCLVACSMKRLNMTDQHGDIRVNTIRQELIPYSKSMADAVDKCGASKASGECESEFLFMTCFVNELFRVLPLMMDDNEE